jgi:hypothetical protein
MADELGAATRALKRAVQGKGWVKRLRGVKGIPDFILTFKTHPGIPVFTELKHEKPNIHPIQAATIDELHNMGCVTILLILTSDNRWAIFLPPILDKRLKVRTLKDPDIILDELSAIIAIIKQGSMGNEQMGQNAG